MVNFQLSVAFQRNISKVSTKKAPEGIREELEKGPQQHDQIVVKEKRPKVDFFSNNVALLHRLYDPAFSNKFSVKMFTTVHGHQLCEYDIILFDDGILPFEVETYLTRDAARRESEELVKIRPRGWSPPRWFPSAAYVKLNFARYAEETQTILDQANKQLQALQTHVRNDGGFSIIRLADPVTNRYVARRCVLLPSTALADWGKDFAQNTAQLVEMSYEKFPPEYMKRFSNFFELKKCFYFKRGLNAKGRRNFSQTPLWQLDLMLRKWRADRALKEWAESYPYQFQK